MNCIYCKEELLYPWEKRRFDCDLCHYAFNPTFHEEVEGEEAE